MRSIEHTITFDRLQRDFDISTIRSIEVDHSRGILRIVCDPEAPRVGEGAHVPHGKTFSTMENE